MSEVYYKFSKIMGIINILFGLLLITCPLLLFACRLKYDPENFSLIIIVLLCYHPLRIVFKIVAGFDCLLEDEIGFAHVEFD